MSNCSFYKVKTLVLPSRQINPSRQEPAPSVAHVPCCTHDASPFPESMTGNLGAATALRCRGDIAACQITPNPHP